MNQFPSSSPAPQPPRRPVQRSRRAGKRRARRAAPLLNLWQSLILLALAAGVGLSAWSLGRANGSLTALEEAREQARRQYENEVARHQVKYRELIEYYAAVYQLEPAYVAAIIKRESDYDPRAVSSKNAKGLMQFMPDTFEWVAPKFGISKDDTDAVYDPENAIKMGCWLLNYISQKFDGNPILVACAYHAGWGNVNSWLEKYSSDGKTLTLAQIPTDDTRYYAGKVLNAYAIYQQHYY